MRRLALLLPLVALLALATPLGAAAAPGTPTPRGSAADRAIVVLRDDAADPPAVAADLGRRHGFQPEFVYEHALRGFAATIPAARRAAVAADPRVQFISEDREVSIAAQVAPTGVGRIKASTNGTTQTLANDGAGVGVAVLDTGIDLKHRDLGGVVNAKSCVRGARTANDDHGHGTHVAGTIAARDNDQGVVGVAPGATLYAVKVLDANGGGSWSAIICGIDWVAANAKHADGSQKIHVANMSLGGGGSATPSDANCNNSNNDALHKAICLSVRAGVTYAVAAGNSGADAGGFVPAAYEEVIAVSALNDATDRFPIFSNYGGAVDIAAPGVGIYSTARGGGYTTMSGTSMASPHVAGVAALYLKTNPAATPAAVMAALRDTGECPAGGATFADPNHGGSLSCTAAWPDESGDTNRRHEPLVRADKQ